MTDATLLGKARVPRVGGRYVDRLISYRHLRVQEVYPGAPAQREVVGVLEYAEGHESHDHHGREYSVDLARFWAIWKPIEE